MDLIGAGLPRILWKLLPPREVGMRLPGEHALTKIKSSSSSSEDKETPPPFGHSSIVAVAHQMIADSKNHDLQTDSIPHRLRVRRNSKSLPTSPQSSPKMFRKNPFFTNIFFGSSELVNVTEETKPVTRTTSTEDARLESWSSKVVRAFSDVDAASPTMKSPPPVKALKAKPSELREMNFWSPTSM